MIARTVEAQMRGKLVRQAADLASAHRIGLTGDGERTHPRAADASRRQVAIDDRVDLVGARGGLVHTLRIHRQRTLGRGEPMVECGDRACGKAACRRDASQVGGLGTGHVERRRKPRRVARDPVVIERTICGKMRQQPVEQQHVAARCERQMQVGVVGRRGAAWVQHHDARAARGACGQQPLIQDRMAPRRVAADQHDKVGFVRSPHRPRAPRPRRMPARGPPPRTPCTAGNSCRYWRCR